MKFIRYYREGHYLKFTKLYPRFVAIVDCSDGMPSIKQMDPGSCSPGQIVSNLDELYAFLDSDLYDELIHPEPSRKNPFVKPGKDLTANK